MLNYIPVIGWALSFLFNASAALIFWLTWTVYGIGAKYFYFLPDTYLHIGFWDSLMLFIVTGIIYSKFVPRFFGGSSSSASAAKD